MQNKKVNKASTDVKLTKAPDVKAEVKESVKEAAKKVETVTKKAEAAAETTVKKAEAAAEAKAETAAKKVEKAKTTAKKAVKKTVKEPAKTELIVEFQGNAASIATQIFSPRFSYTSGSSVGPSFLIKSLIPFNASHG